MPTSVPIWVTLSIPDSILPNHCEETNKHRRHLRSTEAAVQSAFLPALTRGKSSIDTNHPVTLALRIATASAPTHFGYLRFGHSPNSELSVPSMQMLSLNLATAETVLAWSKI